MQAEVLEHLVDQNYSGSMQKQGCVALRCQIQGESPETSERQKTEGIYTDAQGSELQETDNSRLYRIAKSLVVHVRNADADVTMY